MSYNTRDLYRKQHVPVSRAYDASILSTGTTTDASASGPFTTGTTATTYEGIPAYRILTTAKQIAIPTGLSLSNPLDFQENGIIEGFTIAVNDPNFQVTCILYGQDDSQTILNDQTMQAVTALGRGLTQGQAESTGPQGQSLDQQCVKDDLWPYIQRYRGTFSLQAILSGATEKQVIGTLDDRWIVLSYAPSIKKGYTRFYLNVTHQLGSIQPNVPDIENNGLIHLMQVSRIKFQTNTTTMYTTGSANLAEAYDPQHLNFSNQNY